ncbi:patatin-like phospholipase family protein [uncultured Enterovirga sp.]|uniref:patatin-like phospholipase family protein n=1 Tax=uncultured Enterovirga sp. TaxID=2026352 RepID=UPI0035CC5BF5
MADGGTRLSPIDGGRLEDLIGLCLSGGGYRAMLFHAGAVFRLNDLGLLRKLDRVSSVSGGAMTAAALAMAYPRFDYDAEGKATNLRETFLEPIRRQANDAIDIASAFAGLNPFSSAAKAAARSYDANLTDGARLSSLRSRPMFVFNATNLMTGVTMRFRPDYVADYQIGQITGLDLSLAEVVAASAAFPPVLSPAVIDLMGGDTVGGSEGPLARPPYVEKAVLTDGGVYDNMATEAVWKRCRTIFASNAGKPFDFEPDPAHNWLQQSLRLIDILMDQAEDLRERMLAHAYEVGARRGAMWGLTSGLNDPTDRPPLLSPDEYAAAQAVPTRLTRLSDEEVTLMLKAGYAHASSRLRKHYGPDKGGPADTPDHRWPQP